MEAVTEIREYTVSHSISPEHVSDVDKGASALELAIRLAGKEPDYVYCLVDKSRDPFPSIGAQAFTKARERLGEDPSADTAPACDLRASDFERALELARCRIQSGLSKTVALVNLAGPSAQADGLGALIMDGQGTASQNGFYTNISYQSKQVPDRRLTNAQLASLLNMSPDEIERRTKILERPVAGNKDTLVTLAASVANQILKKGGISKSQVKYLLLSSSTPFPEPGLQNSGMRNGAYSSIAEAVADELGFKQGEVKCLDILAGCSGWCYAVDAGRAIIESNPESFTGNYILAIATEILRRNIVNDYDKNTSMLFGDAAAGAALNASQTHGILATVGAANGSMADLIKIGSPDPTLNYKRYIEMNGMPVFKWAIGLIPRRVLEVARKAGIEPSSIDLLVIHQANGRINENAASLLHDESGIPPNRYFSNIRYRANTSSVSVPLGLADAAELKEFTTTSRTVLGSFGAAGQVMFHYHE